MSTAVKTICPKMFPTIFPTQKTNSTKPFQVAMAEDIFRKPVQGARQDGAKGLAVGCGTGIAGVAGVATDV